MGGGWVGKVIRPSIQPPKKSSWFVHIHICAQARCATTARRRFLLNGDLLHMYHQPRNCIETCLSLLYSVCHQTRHLTLVTQNTWYMPITPSWRISLHIRREMLHCYPGCAQKWSTWSVGAPMDAGFRAWYLLSSYEKTTIF